MKTEVQENDVVIALLNPKNCLDYPCDINPFDREPMPYKASYIITQGPWRGQWAFYPCFDAEFKIVREQDLDIKTIPGKCR